MINITNNLWENIVVTGGAGFIGSNLVLELQRRFPKSHIDVVDDFRSGDFANLEDFRGDVQAFDVSRIDMADLFYNRPPTVMFHLASITDTTVTDDKLMLHDNVEGFRGILDYCIENNVPLVYASSAATYGIGEGRMSEDNTPAPANVYAFSKTILDNVARKAMKDIPEQHIVGLKFFNVYGPREGHKKIASSMIYHLSRMMKEGKRPRIFAPGDQKRDFVYVRDVVDAIIAALGAEESGIYNVGSGRARSFNELCAILNDVLGIDLAPEYFECPYPFYQPFTEADLTRAKAALGYEPKYSLEDGVADYMKFLYG